MPYLRSITVALVLIVLATSCGNVKNLQYLQGSFDTTRLRKVEAPEPRIQKGDLLDITVYSADPAATAAVMYQLPLPATGGNSQDASQSLPIGVSGSAGAAAGYLVNQQGEIQLYKLGNLKLEGMTKREAGDTIALLFEKQQLLKSPFVQVKFLNYKITLIGEISKPGTYNIPTAKINIFEAVGLAGDITVYGKRDNVLVVREANGVREFGRLDLSKTDVFLSPYFYLQQNDMIIVDVARNKAAVNDQITMRNITVAASILSTIAIFINVFRR